MTSEARSSRRRKMTRRLHCPSLSRTRPRSRIGVIARKGGNTRPASRRLWG
jgi:hypothetical protein